MAQSKSQAIIHRLSFFCEHNDNEPFTRQVKEPHTDKTPFLPGSNDRQTQITKRVVY